MKKFLHFKANCSFNLFLNGEFVDFCDTNDSLDIIMTTGKINYMFCPVGLNGSIIDSGFISASKSELLCSSSCVKIIQIDKCHYYVYFMTKTITNTAKKEIINQKLINNSCIMVSNNDTGIIDVFVDNRNVFRCPLQQSIIMAEIREVECGVMIIACLDNGMRAVVIVDTKDCKLLYSKTADSIDIVDGQIECLVDQKCMLGVGLVSTYNFSKNITNEYPIYIKKHEKTKNNLVVPYAFLLSIQMKCFNIAKSYLSDNFVVDDNQLVSFFGNYNEIYYNAYNNDEKIIYLTGGDKVNRYEFIVENGKIVDIVPMPYC